MKRYFTESRVAIAISVISAVITITVSTAQWKEARIANSLNEERVNVAIQPNNDPKITVDMTRCDGYEVSIPLAWRINVFNNSAQPITIQSASFSAYSVRGTVMRIDMHEGRDTTGLSFPMTIAARGFETLEVTVPVFAPQKYATWFRAAGLCNNHSLDIQKLAERAGFDWTGGSPGHPSNAGIAVALNTSDGTVVQRQVNWVPVVNVEGPEIKMP